VSPAPAPRGDERDLGHGEQAVQQNQAEQDSDFHGGSRDIAMALA
jgi:hypothetical protein